MKTEQFKQEKYRVGRRSGNVILSTENSIEVARATTPELANKICDLLNKGEQQREQLKCFADYAQTRMWEEGDKDLNIF